MLIMILKSISEIDTFISLRYIKNLYRDCEAMRR